MESNPRNHEIEQKANQQGEEKQPKKNVGTERKPRVSLVLALAGFSILLTSWGGIYANFGHIFKLIAPFVMLAASLCAALGLRLELRNYHWFKWQYNAVACLVVVCASLFAVPLFLNEALQKENSPHFKFSLSLADAPDTVIELTNCPPENILHSKSLRLCLVPKREGQTNFVLLFAARNDSSVVAVENTEFIIEFSRSWARVADPYWAEFRRIDPLPPTNALPPNVTPDPMQAVVFHARFPLLPSSGIGLPPLTLSNANEDMEYCSFVILSRTKQPSPHSAIGFALLFVPPSKGHISKPLWQSAPITKDWQLQIFIPTNSPSN